LICSIVFLPIIEDALSNFIFGSLDVFLKRELRARFIPGRIQPPI
jgi:hypothetical protein